MSAWHHNFQDKISKMSVKSANIITSWNHHLHHAEQQDNMEITCECEWHITGMRENTRWEKLHWITHPKSRDKGWVCRYDYQVDQSSDHRHNSNPKHSLQALCNGIEVSTGRTLKTPSQESPANWVFSLFYRKRELFVTLQVIRVLLQGMLGEVKAFE
jgi:hypothetical protein